MFFLLDLNVQVFFFRNGWFMCGFYSFIVWFWFGWDKLKVQQVKIELFYRLQMLDECF